MKKGERVANYQGGRSERNPGGRAFFGEESLFWVEESEGDLETRRTRDTYG